MRDVSEGTRANGRVHESPLSQQEKDAAWPGAVGVNRDGGQEQISEDDTSAKKENADDMLVMKWLVIGNLLYPLNGFKYNSKFRRLHRSIRKAAFSIR